MPSILDLRVQLANRTARARALILFIGDNGGLGKVRHAELPKNFTGKLTITNYSYHKAREDN